MTNPLCEDYAMGDVVIDTDSGSRSQVSCRECLEWLHA